MDSKHNTEEKILDAAMDIFLDKGLYGAKMQEIADKAGINKAMLHYYFRSKDKLYAHVFEKVFSGLFGQLHYVFATNDPFKVKVTNFVNSYIDLIKQNPRIPSFIIREIGEGGETAAMVLNKITTEQKNVLPLTFIQSVRMAIQNKEIRNLDPRQLVVTILGACVFFFVAEPIINVFLEKDTNYDRSIFLEERKNAIIDTIFNGINP